MSGYVASAAFADEKSGILIGPRQYFQAKTNAPNRHQCFRNPAKNFHVASFNFPDIPSREIASQHTVYKSFYDIKIQGFL
tara:strand:- start:1852 stop:2091 length:240 start_codon:yes stop_codon:yes gene_type:complete